MRERERVRAREGGRERDAICLLRLTLTANERYGAIRSSNYSNHSTGTAGPVRPGTRGAVCVWVSLLPVPQSQSASYTLQPARGKRGVSEQEFNISGHSSIQIKFLIDFFPQCISEVSIKLYILRKL